MIDICIVFSGNNFNQNSRDHFNDDNHVGTERQTDDTGNNIRNFAYGDHSANVSQRHRQHDEMNENAPFMATATNSVNVHSNVTTVDALIESVAANGDFFEEKVRSQHRDLVRSPFW